MQQQTCFFFFWETLVFFFFGKTLVQFPDHSSTPAADVFYTLTLTEADDNTGKTVAQCGKQENVC